MSYNFDKYDDVSVNIDRVSKQSKYSKQSKQSKQSKYNDDNKKKKDKILITRERDLRYSPKNLRIINKDFKDFNNNEYIPHQIYWDWDFGFDLELESELFHLDYSSIQASPTLSCSSSSSYLKSFDIPWIEL